MELSTETMQIRTPSLHANKIHARLLRWDGQHLGRRIWDRDFTVWSSTRVPEITGRLGWLTLPETMLGEVPAMRNLAEEVKSEGIEDIVLLGMGGSSLAPDVFQTTFSNTPGYPRST
jgi:transaldolase/glucose-6-phosphate isomerase